MIPAPCPNELVHDADDDWETAKYSQDADALREIALAWIVRAVHWEGTGPRHKRPKRVEELKQRLRNAENLASERFEKNARLEAEITRLRSDLLSAFQRIKDQADLLEQLGAK
jgi:hypothetical protein